jgi:hypothetical protein
MGVLNYILLIINWSLISSTPFLNISRINRWWCLVGRDKFSFGHRLENSKQRVAPIKLSVWIISHIQTIMYDFSRGFCYWFKNQWNSIANHKRLIWSLSLLDVYRPERAEGDIYIMIRRILLIITFATVLDSRVQANSTEKSIVEKTYKKILPCLTLSQTLSGMYLLM